MFKKTVAILGLISALFVSSTGTADPPGTEHHIKNTISAEVTTKETGWDGIRHSATSGWTAFTVPPGYVIVKDRSVLRELSIAGTDNRVTIVYENEVEVIPGSGIMLPRSVKLQVHARSPKGIQSGRGWTKTELDFYYTKFQ
jgi:hypothetical protein